MIELIIIILGLAFGSFANVLIHRIPLGENFSTQRSRCPSCRNTIAFYDNIPILSYLLLKAKCRHCGAYISKRYPLVEILTALLFLMAYLQYRWTLEAAVAMAALFILLVLSLIDLDTMHVPDGLILSGIILSCFSLLVAGKEILPYALAAFAYSLSLYLIAFSAKLILKRDSMGGGDIKLAFFLGLLLGPISTLLAAFLAFILAAIILILLKWAGKVKFGQEVPFVPFMAAGAALSLLYGNEILKFYQNYFIP